MSGCLPVKFLGAKIHQPFGEYFLHVIDAQCREITFKADNKIINSGEIIIKVIKNNSDSKIDAMQD